MRAAKIQNHLAMAAKIRESFNVPAHVPANRIRKPRGITTKRFRKKIRLLKEHEYQATRDIQAGLSKNPVRAKSKNSVKA